MEFLELHYCVVDDHYEYDFLRIPLSNVVHIGIRADGIHEVVYFDYSYYRTAVSVEGPVI